MDHVWNDDAIYVSNLSNKRLCCRIWANSPFLKDNIMYDDSRTVCPFCTAVHSSTGTISHRACFKHNRIVVGGSFWNKTYCTDRTTHVHCRCSYCGGEWKVLVRNS